MNRDAEVMSSHRDRFYSVTHYKLCILHLYCGTVGNRQGFTCGVKVHGTPASVFFFPHVVGIFFCLNLLITFIIFTSV